MLDTLAETFTRLVNNGESYLFLLPIYATLLIGERVIHALTQERKWDDKDAAANIAITSVYLVLDVLVGAILPVGAMALTYEYGRLFTLGYGTLDWILVFLIYDLAWYVDHRIAHRTGFFWALHHVHHSSAEFNMTVASRGFVLDNTKLTRPLFFALPLLGISPFHFIAVVIVTNIWGIAQHTRLVGKLKWLDLILATPSNHRVHHGSDPKYLDRNYGEVLIIWDHLFGTYQPEEEEPTYGVTEPIQTYNPVLIEVAGLRWLARKLRAAPTWGDKLRCLVYPPGWTPPGAS